MAANQNPGIGLPKRPLGPPPASLANARPLLDTAEHSGRGRRILSRAKRSSRFDHATARTAYGYPASWPAGPWVVPLFWLAVLALVLLQLFQG
jgi:hypothetical protein